MVCLLFYGERYGNGNIFAVPPAFGKGDIQMRIQNNMHYKRTSKKAVVMAVAVGIFLTGIFLTAKDQDDAHAIAQASDKVQKSIEDWLTLELPDRYTLGSYNENLGYIGGALIFPEVYQIQGKMESAPEHWKYAGFIGEVSAPQDIFVFENGRLDERYFPKSNHSSEEPIGFMDTISVGLGWSTLMVHGFHDLYTAADLAELELSGVDISSLETQSEYWYFYFVKELEILRLLGY